jgi:polar amino acid transport system ATP-binding protein
MTTPSDGSPLLEVTGVWKSFDEHPVLRGLDLEVFSHQAVVLIGASGSGKSTLLRCVNGLESVDAGRIVLDGQVEVSDPAIDLDQVRRRVGIVFQSYNLFPHMTVLDNVTLAPRKVAKVSAEQARAEALVLLERFGLGGKAGDYPDRLSGGQAQRVAIVRALAMQPELMLFDEITSALDPLLVGEVLDAVRELKAGGLTIVMATHEMGFAREVADRVCFLRDGIVWEQGSPDQVFGDPQRSETREFLARVLG